MFPNVSVLSVALLIVISYLVGSIPSTLIASRLTANVDLRLFGSGSAGGTNAIRVLGPVLGLIAGIADVAKGLICAAVLAPAWFQTDGDVAVWKVAAGGAAVVGHIWPLWAGFKGGKGVATGMGTLVALDLPAAIIFAVVGLSAAAVSKYVSVGSLTASITLPLVLILETTVLNRPVHAAVISFGLALPLVVLFMHRSNIRRLAAGTEFRLGHRVVIDADRTKRAAGSSNDILTRDRITQ